ncbi:MAG: amidase [Propionibacteriaceae bacterium]|jgi:amidase|nr:amidase [Propionibacteriaceae bacterium]
MGIDLAFTSVIEQARLVADKQCSARDLVQHSLGVISRLNPDLRAFTQVFADAALAVADSLDAGPVTGPLHGVPIAVKDEIDVAGYRTCFGTNAVTHIAKSDAEVVRRLREAGAIIIGKTAMPEFGQWPFTESTANGYTRNPWNRMCSTAGSSGGTAAAVASGMVAAGLGGDGGGSIRLPSSWCGLFGVKSQRGRISAAPNPSLWRALGVSGPLTRTVADSALLFDVLASHLPTDRFAAEPWDRTLSEAVTQDPGPLRVRVIEDPPDGGPKAEPQTKEALRAVGVALAGLGHDVATGGWPPYKAGFMMTAQMAGGVIDELAAIDSVKGLEKRTRRALLLYRILNALSAKAETDAAAAGEVFFKVFDEVDVILTPTTYRHALPVGQLDGLGVLATSRVSLPISAYTSIWNVLGNPAAAVPAGFSRDGLPLSVQIATAPNREPLLFQVAAQIEKALPWADRKPAL